MRGLWLLCLLAAGQLPSSLAWTTVSLKRVCAAAAAALIVDCAAAAPAALAVAPAPPPLGTCTVESNPQTTTQFCRILGLVDNDQRVRGCQANENCFSTSAVSSGKRSSPWLFQQNLEDAVLIVTDAIKLEGLTILQSKSVSSGHYILAAEKNPPRQPPGSSSFFEFVVKPGNSKDNTPNVVLNRAVIDKTIFVYPLQQPVSDGGYLQAKLESIKSRTGFTVEAGIDAVPHEASDFEEILGMARAR